MKTVLIIDDDLGFIFWLGRALQDAGYEALPARGFSEASVILRELNTEIDLLTVNSSLAGAADFVNALRRSRAKVKILAVLNNEARLGEQIRDADVTARKPLQPDGAAETVWLQMVEQALSRRNGAEQNGNGRSGDSEAQRAG